MLRVSHIEKSTTLLGPYDRYVIWVYGCCFDCKGCVAENTRFGEYVDIDIENVASDIANSSVEGVTISGGEPFLQASEIYRMIRCVRSMRDIGVIIYSGYTIEELRDNFDARQLLSEVDILIDGRYEQVLDDGRAYIGSSNQRIHYLTDRYQLAGTIYYAEKQRRCEIKFSERETVLIGVPSSSTLSIWRALKSKVR